MMPQNHKIIWEPFLGTKQGGLETKDCYSLLVYIKSNLMQFILIHIQWNVTVGSNCLIFQCSMYICGWIMGIAMGWLGLVIECFAAMAKNLNHNNYQAACCSSEQNLYQLFSVCPASSKQGSDLGWGHLYVTAVLFIKKVAIWSWMMYDQENQLIFTLSYRGLPDWENFWSFQDLEIDYHNFI